MARVLLTRVAEEDLLAIWSYIADDDPDAADCLLDRIDQRGTALAETPRAGRAREELAPDEKPARRELRDLLPSRR